MKKLKNLTLVYVSLIVVGLLVSTVSAVASNPQIRACRATGGEFKAISIAEDQVGFCSYQGSLVDSLSLESLVVSLEKTKAIEVYENTDQQPVSSCEEVNATLIQAQDLEGYPYSICQFSDYSFIELQTLVQGRLSPSNKALNKALSVRF